MDSFQKQVKLELLKQQRLLEEQRQILCSSPEGFLFSRHRSKKDTYYHQRKIRDGRGWKNVQVNISDDPLLQSALFDKRIAEKSIKIYENNIPLLEKLSTQYQSADFSDILKGIPPRYNDLKKLHELQEMEKWMQAPYKRDTRYPESLTHRTAYGDFVRSKGEAIIANGLYSFGIPFRSEQELYLPDADWCTYYPDFTILLPNHKFLYWEHWGLLDKYNYRRDNVEKLLAYQQHNLILGDNLIITQDDADMNCRSDIVYNIIEKQILPYYEGIPLPRRAI